MKYFLFCALAFVSCSKSEPKTILAPDPVEVAPVQPANLVPVDMSNHPPIQVLPDTEIQAHVGRAPRRLTVDQLKASIQTTTGRQWSKIDSLAATLGKADFAISVSHSTETNLVFTKFLDDGAREVCMAAATADLTAAANARVLSKIVPSGKDFSTMTDPQINETLDKLAIQFWGSPLGSAEKPLWATTFKKIALKAKTIAKPEQAWGSMCVAFMTDSRFIFY
jgi:hypothetical protein